MTQNIRRGYNPVDPGPIMNDIYKGCLPPFTDPPECGEMIQYATLLENYINLSLSTFEPSNLLMTPISSFIAPNKWAQHVNECGHNIIRSE